MNCTYRIFTWGCNGGIIDRAELQDAFVPVSVAVTRSKDDGVDAITVERVEQIGVTPMGYAQNGAWVPCR